MNSKYSITPEGFICDRIEMTDIFNGKMLRGRSKPFTKLVIDEKTDGIISRILSNNLWDENFGEVVIRKILNNINF